MKSLQSFLEAAPKTALTAIHQKFVGKKGLLNNARILQESIDIIGSPARLADWVSKLEAWQLACIQWIYASRTRGLTASEIMVATARENQVALPAFLLEAAESLILFRTTTPGQSAYFGFTDFNHQFRMALSEGASTPTTRWHHNGNQLIWHLARTCALIQKGQLKVTATGEIHRRSQTVLEAAFASTAFLSEVAQADERILLLQFLSEHGWFNISEGEISLGEGAFACLAQHPGRLRHQICNWWISQRFGEGPQALRQLLSDWPESVDLGSLSRALWPLTPFTRHPSSGQTHAWASLPRVVRELWLLGLIEINLHQSRHSLVRLSPEGKCWMEHGTWLHEAEPPHPPRSTANFEAVFSTHSPLRHLFTAACIAEPLSDEGFIRIQFTKDTLLDALRSGLSIKWLQDFMTWAHLPDSVAQGVDEWISVHSGSNIRHNATVLHIQSKDRWAELANFPQFVSHTEEQIPNWGFIIKSGHEKTVREMLSQFGLEPPPTPGNITSQILGSAPWNKEFSLSVPANGTPDYEWQPTEARTAMASAMVGQSKYTTDFQTLDQGQELKVLRYAMVMEIPVEAILTDPALPKAQPRNETFSISRINNRREPYRISGHRADLSSVEITIDQIVKLRLTSI